MNGGPNPLEPLLKALEKYPQRVEVVPLRELVVESARENDKRPAFVKLHLPDEVVKALGGGIAVQHRMAFQGEYFIERYGKQAAEHSPPISRMLKMEVPVGAGTDGTRVSSYNPWPSLSWLVSGKTVGGTKLLPIMAQNSAAFFGPTSAGSGGASSGFQKLSAQTKTR